MPAPPINFEQTLAVAVRALSRRREAAPRSTAAKRRRLARAGAFTILEVILSLVILGAALAMLGEVMHLANQNAANARAETQAQLYAASIMDQIMAGAIDASNASRQPLEVDDPARWVYSVTIGTSNIEGIVPVEVVVEQDLEPRLNPVKYRLFRWLPAYSEMPEGMEAGSGQGSGQYGGAGGGGQQP